MGTGTTGQTLPNTTLPSHRAPSVLNRCIKSSLPKATKQPSGDTLWGKQQRPCTLHSLFRLEVRFNSPCRPARELCRAVEQHSRVWLGAQPHVKWRWPRVPHRSQWRSKRKRHAMHGVTLPLRDSLEKAIYFCKMKTAFETFRMHDPCLSSQKTQGRHVIFSVLQWLHR